MSEALDERSTDDRAASRAFIDDNANCAKSDRRLPADKHTIVISQNNAFPFEIEELNLNKRLRGIKT